MGLVKLDNIFTLTEANTSTSLPFQYHPASLVFNSNSLSTSEASIGGVVTSVAPPETSIETIQVTTLLSAAIDQQQALGGFNKAGLIGAIAGTAAATVAMLGGKQVLSVFEAVTNTVSLASGAMDLALGFFITPFEALSHKTFDDATKVLGLLHAWMKESKPLTMNWDVENGITNKQSYILTSMNVSNAAIKDETGETLAVNVSLNFIKHGTRVEVLV
jgi:hypothetical protein